MSERMIIWLRLVCIFYLILFLPKIISVYNDSSARLQQKKQYVLLGIERLVSEKSFSDSIKPLRLGLVLDKHSHDQMGISTDLTLMRHGFMVHKLAYLPDLSSGSFVMENFFKGIDAVLIDIQDHGLRTYPHARALCTLMKHAAQSHTKVVITDRINPLGSIIEGPVDIVPLRHGMTIGELAGYYNDHVFARKVDLTVIPLRSWKRDQPLEGVLDTGGLLQHIYQDSMLECLSHLDPLKVLKEGDSGRAVVFPQGEELSVWEINYFKELCNTLGFNVADYAYWNKDQKRLFKGVRLGIKSDASEFSTLNSLLTLMRFLKTRKSISLTSTQEFEHMIGGKEVRLFLEGRLSFAKFKKGIEKNVEKFYAKSKDYFLYEPFPQIKPLQLVKNS